jgi:hypothetical protein
MARWSERDAPAGDEWGSEEGAEEAFLYPAIVIWGRELRKHLVTCTARVSLLPTHGRDYAQLQYSRLSWTSNR